MAWENARKFQFGMKTNIFRFQPMSIHFNPSSFPWIPPLLWAFSWLPCGRLGSVGLALLWGEVSKVDPMTSNDIWNNYQCFLDLLRYVDANHVISCYIFIIFISCSLITTIFGGLKVQSVEGLAMPLNVSLISGKAPKHRNASFTRWCVMWLGLIGFRNVAMLREVFTKYPKQLVNI